MSSSAVHFIPLALSLLLIVVANGAPIIARNFMGRRMARPLDHGLDFFDGRPLLGHSKTVRGLAASILMTAVVAMFLNYPVWLGALIGASAMCGDLLSSFIKRRLGLEASAKALGLDQIPESLIPLLAVSGHLGLGWLDVVLGVLMFFIIELLLSRLLFRLRIRSHPH